jgi:hypothetical protein
MRRIIGAALTGLLVIGMVVVGAAQLTGWRSGGARLANPGASRAFSSSSSDPSTPAEMTTVRGVVGSEKKAFFADPEVKRVFAASGLVVEVDTAGSREIATSTDLDDYDFAFPSSAPAAEKIKRERETLGVYSPFYSPIAIASFQPIVDVLQSAGVAQKTPAGYWTFDVKAYLTLVAKQTRWDQIEGNATYPASKTMLVTTTDVRRSNSAAMYLALASYTANGNRIVSDKREAVAVLPSMARLFLGQGYSESSTEAPFEDYLALGPGKTPMLLTYESLFLDRQMRNDGSITKDMLLLYPTPDVLSKHTILALTDNGDKAGQLLSENADLQRLAAKYGFRTTNPAIFRDVVTSSGVALPPDLMNIVEPPRYEVLEYMIATLEKQY